MKRVGVIGAGRIAAPVIAFLQRDPHFALTGVLARRARSDLDYPYETQADDFFARDFDLIVEAAGPSALRAYGAAALRIADVWSVSAGALVDNDFRRRLEAIGAESGHRLRLVSGSVSGLDGASAIAASAPAVELNLFATRPNLSETSGVAFAGSLRDAARAYPNDVNFAVATAIAAGGLDNAVIELKDSGIGGAHELGFQARDGFGEIESRVRFNPLSDGALHPVAASLIAALRRETQTIWAG